MFISRLKKLFCYQRRHVVRGKYTLNIFLVISSITLPVNAAINFSNGQHTAELREVLKSGQLGEQAISPQTRKRLEETLKIIDEREEAKAIAAEARAKESISNQQTADELAANRKKLIRNVKGAAERLAELPICTPKEGKVCKFEFKPSPLIQQGVGFVLDGWVCDKQLTVINGGVDATHNFVGSMSKLQTQLSELAISSNFDIPTEERHFRIVKAGFSGFRPITIAGLEDLAEQQIKPINMPEKQETLIEGAHMSRGEQGRMRLNCWQSSDFETAGKLRRAATLHARDSLLAFEQRLRQGPIGAKP